MSNISYFPRGEWSVRRVEGEGWGLRAAASRLVNAAASLLKVTTMCAERRDHLKHTAYVKQQEGPNEADAKGKGEHGEGGRSMGGHVSPPLT